MMPQPAVAVGVRTCDAHDAFREYLDAINVPLVCLGQEDVYAQEYSVLTVSFHGSLVGAVGIMSYVTGVHPRHIVRGKRMFIGHDKMLAVVQVCPFALVGDTYLGEAELFWDFLEVSEECGVCVLCETGVIATDDSGRIRWRYLKDVVKAFRVDRDEVLLEYVDGAPCRLDLKSGRASPV